MSSDPTIEQRLRDAAEAYPEDVFKPLTDEDREDHPIIITQASAGMGRHFAPLFLAAAERIANLEAEVDRLRGVAESCKAVRISAVRRAKKNHRRANAKHQEADELYAQVQSLQARAEAAEAKLATRTRVYTDVVDRLEDERDRFQKLASHYDSVLRDFADALCVEREEDGSPCLGKSPVLWVIKLNDRLAAADRLAEALDDFIDANEALETQHSGGDAEFSDEDSDLVTEAVAAKERVVEALAAYNQASKDKDA